MSFEWTPRPSIKIKVLNIFLSFILIIFNAPNIVFIQTKKVNINGDRYNTLKKYLSSYFTIKLKI
jgi:hypothetical protein